MVGKNDYNFSPILSSNFNFSLLILILSRVTSDHYGTSSEMCSCTIAYFFLFQWVCPYALQMKYFLILLRYLSVY